MRQSDPSTTSDLGDPNIGILLTHAMQMMHNWSDNISKFGRYPYIHAISMSSRIPPLSQIKMEN